MSEYEDDNDMILSVDDEENLLAFQQIKEEGIDYEEEFLLKAAPAASSHVGTHLVPFTIVPIEESTAVRPEYAVVNNVAYYNHLSLLVLTYGQVTQGIKAGAIYDAEKQKLKEKRVEFDF